MNDADRQPSEATRQANGFEGLLGDPTVRIASARTPSSLLAFVIWVSGWHQLGLASLSVAAFAMAVVPLELQRRIINDALQSRSISEIARLAGYYIAIALSGGLAKLVLNLYRSWVGENAVLQLRDSLLSDLGGPDTGHHPAKDGIKVSLVMDEADPIGGFVGSCISEPLLQGGILLSVFGYMVYLDSLMALVTFLIFAPQFVFVPLMQHAINRRVSGRIDALRLISVGIVGGATKDPSGTQRELIESVFVLNMGIYKLKFSMNFLMNLVHHVGICAILALGGYWILQGRSEVGTVVAFLSGLNQINDPWGDLVDWFRNLQVTRTKYARIVGAILKLRAF